MIGGLVQAILYVQDMDAQVHFYRDVMGLTLRFPQDLASYASEFWVEFETGQCTLALHAGGKGRLGEDAPRFSFEVENMESTRALLLQRGVTLGEVRSPAPGILVCDARDPEGNGFAIRSQT
jgi:catechol 2,3-dioxygenase-like lactoylglutathione lyase family enzyme